MITIALLLVCLCRGIVLDPRCWRPPDATNTLDRCIRSVPARSAILLRVRDIRLRAALTFPVGRLSCPILPGWHWLRGAV